MKAEITEIVFLESYTSKYGELHKHKVTFMDEFLNRITAFYSSKTNPQTYFKEGQEAEFDLEELTGKEGRKFYKMRRPKQAGGNPNYNREKKREQTKYSGFSASYVKDMIVAGIIQPEIPDDGNVLSISELNDQVLLTWRKRSAEIFTHLVKLDKSLEL